MMNILDYIPQNGYCSRLFIVGPYPMDTYIKKLQKELYARQGDEFEIFVYADEAWNTDIVEDIKKIPNTKVVLVKTENSCGIVHAKMYFLECKNQNDSSVSTLIVGSGNASVNGMTNNAEVMTVARLAQFKKKSRIDIKNYFESFVKKNCDRVNEVVAKFENPVGPSSVILPTLIRSDRTISFYSWLRSGYLFYKYEKDQNFGYIVINLEKPLPSNRTIGKLIKKSIFNNDGEIHSLRYPYLKLDTIKEKCLHPSNYALLSDYGYWISKDCFKEKKNYIFQEITSSDLFEAVEKKRKTQNKIAEKICKSLRTLRRNSQLKECIGSKINEVYSIVAKKINRDYKMSKDENFVFRYKTGYAQHKMPNLDDSDFKEFLDSAMGTCLIKLNGNSVRNLFVKKLRDILEKNAKQFDDPEDLSHWLNKKWPRLYDQLRFYYKNEIVIVQQKYKTDCGIACVAMLTGKGYDSVMNKAKSIFSRNWGKENNYRTDNNQIKQLIKAFCPYFNGRFKPFDSWEDIQECCLVRVHCNENNDECHWVIADKIDDDLIVYDPEKTKPIVNFDGHLYKNVHQYLPFSS